MRICAWVHRSTAAWIFLPSTLFVVSLMQGMVIIAVIYAD
jgi:hypothetical protein